MGLDNPIHIAFLVVILLLVFGARRLPEIGRSLGSGMREFKDSISGEAKQPTLNQTAQQPPVQQPPVEQPPVEQPQPPVAQPVATPPPGPTAGSGRAAGRKPLRSVARGAGSAQRATREPIPTQVPPAAPEAPWEPQGQQQRRQLQTGAEWETAHRSLSARLGLVRPPTVSRSGRSLRSLAHRRLRASCRA